MTFPQPRYRRVRKTVMASLTATLVALLGIPLLATPAAAAPTATVVISQATTPPAVSVDVGGTVTFVNSIPARTDLLGVTLATDVTLAVPSGSHVIAPGASWSEVFYASCLTCTVSYKYRVTAGILPPLAGLPALPINLPMVVNTIVPLPSIAPPPVIVPSLPAPTLPGTPAAPTVPGTETAGTLPGTETPSDPTTVGGTPTGGTTSSGATVGEQIMPSGGGPLILGAPNGFEQRRRTSSDPYGMTGGSGTGIGSYDGAQAPMFGMLDGLEQQPSDQATGVLPTATERSEPVPNALGTPALLAVLLISVVAAGLVRTSLTSRRTTRSSALRAD